MASQPFLDLLRVEVDSLEALYNWFDAHHAQSASIWLVTYKKCVPQHYIPFTEVLDACVIYGWIDGRKMRLDAHRTMQLLAPRKSTHWAKSYKDRYERLALAGRMHPWGLRQVEAARANGGWEAMTAVDALVVPPDLAAALEACPQAWANYLDFPPSTQRELLRQLHLARKPETRIRRIQQIVTRAERNQRTFGPEAPTLRQG